MAHIVSGVRLRQTCNDIKQSQGYYAVLFLIISLHIQMFVIMIICGVFFFFFAAEQRVLIMCNVVDYR